jgi:hypothetical protein
MELLLKVVLNTHKSPYKTPPPTQPQPTIQCLPGLTLSINLLLQEITEGKVIDDKL